jgi:undecaprenyl-diphosphatase
MPSIRKRRAFAVAAGSAILFAALLAVYFRYDALTGMDAALVDLLGPWRTAAVTTAFLWLTAIGAGPALTAVALAASGLLAGTARARLIVPMWAAFLGSEATTWAGKYLIERSRPELVTEAVVSSPSFPSAHAAGAAVLYGFLAWVILRTRPPVPFRRTAAAFAAAVIVLVGFSRVLLAVHYPSDVLAGWLVAVFWLNLVIGHTPPSAARLSGEALRE